MTDLELLNLYWHRDKVWMAIDSQTLMTIQRDGSPVKVRPRSTPKRASGLNCGRGMGVHSGEWLARYWGVGDDWLDALVDRVMDEHLAGPREDKHRAEMEISDRKVYLRNRRRYVGRDILEGLKIDRFESAGFYRRKRRSSRLKTASAKVFERSAYQPMNQSMPSLNGWDNLIRCYERIHKADN